MWSECGLNGFSTSSFLCWQVVPFDVRFELTKRHADKGKRVNTNNKTTKTREGIMNKNEPATGEQKVGVWNHNSAKTIEATLNKATSARPSSGGASFRHVKDKKEKAKGGKKQGKMWRNNKQNIKNTIMTRRHLHTCEGSHSSDVYCFSFLPTWLEAVFGSRKLTWIRSCSQRQCDEAIEMGEGRM